MTVKLESERANRRPQWLKPGPTDVNHYASEFTEDVVPLSDLKINPGKVVGRAQNTHRPILVTSRGRGIAVVQGLEDYERTAEELRLVKVVAQGVWMFARQATEVVLIRVWRSEDNSN